MNEQQLIHLAKTYKGAGDCIICAAKDILEAQGLWGSPEPIVIISSTVDDETFHIVYFPDCDGMEVSVEREGGDLPDLVRFPCGKHSMIIGHKDKSKPSLLFEKGEVRLFLDGVHTETIQDIGRVS
jgi:hypothetical protein